jgi:hypothetical protein
MHKINLSGKHRRIFQLLSVAFLGMLLHTSCGQKSESSQAVATDLDTAATAENTGMVANSAQTMNVLTEAEKNEGWKLLFDGKTTDGWRGAYKESFPDTGWVVQDGLLSVLASGGAESRHGGDIVSADEYDNFDLSFEFMLTEGANSGVKYFVVEHQPKPAGSAFGLEFQVLDDAKHPDAKMGKNGNRTVGSLYDLIPAATDKQVNPIGEWNQGRVLVQGNHVEHWLNGKKVVEYERGSKEFRDLVAQSKYAASDYNKHGRFGEAPKGRILIQDHGDKVSYRNIKIKPLSKT